MKSEDEPVTDDEYVLRLIHSCYYKAGLDLPIQPEAFRPLDSGDELGISVVRAACLSSPAQALALVRDPGKRHLYYIAQLAVRDLRSLRLSVKPDPLPEVRGHSTIPELNTTEYPLNKPFWKNIQKQLAVWASPQIVHRATP